MHFPEKSSYKTLIKKAEKHYELQLPFSIYRKPGSQKVICVLQQKDALFHCVDYMESGFVFAPYNLSKPPVLLKIDDCLEANYENAGTASVENFFIDEDKFVHLEKVNAAIQTIKKEDLKKVVLSRRIEVDTQKSPFEIFQNCLQQYKNACCYIWYHPKVGLWVGATPETFLRVNQGKLKAMSLAGTLPANGALEPKWTTKEIEEQKLVTTYIKTLFIEHLSNVEVSKTESIRAGKLWHLRSILSGVLQQPSQLKTIIERLHPTPAVCGIPLEKAKTFITAIENYNREFYTGFLGELNFGEFTNTHLFVNLRCLKLQQQQATLFVGGGITSESDPEKEWIETQMKSKTMLSML